MKENKTAMSWKTTDVLYNIKDKVEPQGPYKMWWWYGGELYNDINHSLLGVVLLFQDLCVHGFSPIIL